MSVETIHVQWRSKCLRPLSHSLRSSYRHSVEESWVLCRPQLQFHKSLSFMAGQMKVSKELTASICGPSEYRCRSQNDVQHSERLLIYVDAVLSLGTLSLTYIEICQTSTSLISSTTLAYILKQDLRL